MELTERFTAVETLYVLLDRGYTLAPKCRRSLYEHKDGPCWTTYAETLLVSGGPGLLDEDMREEVRDHQPELLAAACVMAPPIDWMEFLVSRYCVGRLPLFTLARNVAGFMEKNPIDYGPRLEVIIREALEN
jgi:hypothetical protein